jgi:hypothetical protein
MLDRLGKAAKERVRRRQTTMLDRTRHRGEPATEVIRPPSRAGTAKPMMTRATRISTKVSPASEPRSSRFFMPQLPRSTLQLFVQLALCAMTEVMVTFELFCTWKELLGRYKAPPSEKLLTWFSSWKGVESVRD